MANNKTIFQRLNSIFDASGVDLTKVNNQTKNSSNTYSLNNDILLKTPSKEEYELAKLQAQQGKFLSGLWKKSENELLQHSLHYETTRIGSYADFESMEFYPEIAAALDIFMEEATTVNAKGRVLNIYSESKRIQGVLEDLFFNRLDIHLSLPMWTRNICKYGDNFLLLNIDDKNGIVGTRQLPNFEIERKEGDVVYNQYSNEYKINNEGENAKVKFFWRGRDFEFNSWQIAHFRLLGDDRRLPYGTSLLEKARSIWKRLQLAEDAMLVYRITRAPERRIYKIFVGNLDDKDVPAYVDEIANRFKRRPVIDPQTGQIDLRYNQLANDQDYFIPVRDENAATPIDTLQGACVALDTKIPLLDGRTLELQEIIKEWDKGNRDLWVYSCNPETGELAPGMITWAGHTRKNAQVVKITLDNGKTITTTPDHKWVHRTKGFVEAKDLVVGDSLMPFYRDNNYILNKKYAKKYERIWDSKKQEWVFTHRMVSWFMKDLNMERYHIFEGSYEKESMKTIHHMDNNRFNNNPDNLFFMDSRDHYKYHRHELWSTPEKRDKTIKKISNGIVKYISNLSDSDREVRAEQSRINSINSRVKSSNTFRNNPNRSEILKRRGEHISKIKSTEEAKEKMSLMSKEFWKSEEYKNKVFSKNQNLIFTDELYNMFFEMFKLTGRADLALNEVNKSEEFMFEFNKPNLDIRSSLTNLNEFTHNHLKKMLKERGFANYREWSRNTALELGYKNLRAWRYFIEKDKNKIANENYNHKIISIEWLNDTMDTGTITVDGNEIYHNYHTFATDSGVFIKNSNLDAIGDIQYLQRKLFTALRVPKTFLGFEEAVGDGKNLALQDIRFSRTINRIQQAIISELNKIAIIHLYMLGFEDELNNFNLSLNNPSTQAEMLKIEQLQAKMSVYKDAISEAGNGFMGMSMTRARREILGWSDEEIRKDLLEQRLEKAAAAEIEQTSSVIKTTGIFDEVDSIYGDMSAVGTGSPEGQDSDGGMSGGGGFGGGGGGLPPLDTGSPSEEGGLEPVEAPEGGAPEEGGLEPVETPEGGAPEGGAPDSEAPTELSERFNKRKNLIKENVVKHKKLITEKQNYVNKLLDVIDSNEKPLINERVVVYDKNLKINEHINSIIKDIDDMLKD